MRWPKLVGATCVEFPWLLDWEKEHEEEGLDQPVEKFEKQERIQTDSNKAVVARSLCLCGEFHQGLRWSPGRSGKIPSPFQPTSASDIEEDREQTRTPCKSTTEIGNAKMEGALGV